VKNARTVGHPDQIIALGQGQLYKVSTTKSARCFLFLPLTRNRPILLPWYGSMLPTERIVNCTEELEHGISRDSNMFVAMFATKPDQ